MKKGLIIFIPCLLLFAPTRTFYSEWGWGYYYWLFGPIGPSHSEGMAAAGYSGVEYRGYTQFALGGWPGSGTQISSLQLRLLNNTGGAGLQIDINRVTSATPGWSECGGTAPIYLTNQPVTAGADEYTFFELGATPARDDLLAAWQGGASWFGLGLKGSRGSGEPCMHFFYAFWADHYYDAALIVDYVIGVDEKPDNDPIPPVISISPNPFRSATTIAIGLRTEGSGLRVFDVAGKLVKIFSLPASNFQLPVSVFWDGTDQSGRSVPGGVYLVAVETPAGTIYSKVIRIQ